MDRVQLLRNYLQRRAKRYKEQEKALVESLGGPDLPNATKWGFRDRGYLQGCLSAYEMIEDFIDDKLNDSDLSNSFKEKSIEFLEALKKDELESLNHINSKDVGYVGRKRRQVKIKVEVYDFLISVFSGKHEFYKI